MFEELIDDHEMDLYDFGEPDEVEDLYDFDEPDEMEDLYDFDEPDEEEDQYNVDSPPNEAVEVVRPSLHVRKVDESQGGKKRHLTTHSHDSAELERREKRLRTIFLQAAKYGYRELLEKALPVLRRMYETHPKKTGRLLDFHGDRVSVQRDALHEIT